MSFFNQFFAAVTSFVTKAVNVVRDTVHRITGKVEETVNAAVDRVAQYIPRRFLRVLSMAAGMVFMHFVGTGWVVGVLLRFIGFGPLGPVAGSLATWYQSTFLGGFIRGGRTFARLQRAGMTI